MYSGFTIHTREEDKWIQSYSQKKNSKSRNDTRSCIWVEGDYSEESNEYVQDGEDIVFVMVNSVVRIKHYREELCLDANTYNVPHYKTQQMF